MNLNKIDTDQAALAVQSQEKIGESLPIQKHSTLRQPYLETLSFLRELHIACLQRDAQPKRTPRPKDLDPTTEPDPPKGDP